MTETTLLSWLPTLIALLSVSAMWGRMNQTVVTLQNTITGLDETIEALELRIEGLMSKEQCGKCQTACQNMVNLKFTNGAQDIGALKQQLCSLGDGIHRLEISQAIMQAGSGRRGQDKGQFVDFDNNGG